VIDRLLPTLFLVGAGFILGLATAAVYAGIAAWERHRDARRAEATARPPDPDPLDAAASAAATLSARLEEQRRA
jgi:hypothetical protein